jgi:hypothetical protein
MCGYAVWEGQGGCGRLTSTFEMGLDPTGGPCEDTYINRRTGSTLSSRYA